MQSEKICRTIVTVVAGESIVDGKRVPSSITVFSPEDGHAVPEPIIIHKDDKGEMWYWTPEPEIPVDAE